MGNGDSTGGYDLKHNQIIRKLVQHTCNNIKGHLFSVLLTFQFIIQTKSNTVHTNSNTVQTKSDNIKTFPSILKIK